MSLRIASTLPPDLDVLVTQTIGALLAVHRELGSGMSEGVYAAAARVELTARRMRFTTAVRFYAINESIYSLTTGWLWNSSQLSSFTPCMLRRW